MLTGKPWNSVKLTKHSTQVFTSLQRLTEDLSFFFIAMIFYNTHKPVLAEDLDRTLEAPGKRMSPKGDLDADLYEKEVQEMF